MGHVTIQHYTVTFDVSTKQYFLKPTVAGDIKSGWQNHLNHNHVSRKILWSLMHQIPIQHHLVITTCSTPSTNKASRPSNMVSRTARKPTLARRTGREGNKDTTDNVCNSPSTQPPKVLLQKRTFTAKMHALSVPTQAVFSDRHRRKVRYSTTKSIASARRSGIGEGRWSMGLFLSNASAVSSCLSSAGARDSSGSVCGF